MSRRVLRGLRVVVVGLVALLLVPDAAVRPPVVSLQATATAKGVDYSDGQVWVLVLGADAEGHTDAIQLVGIDAPRRRTVVIGIPRDAWVDTPGEGFQRINEAYADGGPYLAGRVVEAVTGIAPDLVLWVDADGFVDLLDRVGPVDVRTPIGFRTEGVTIRPGRNTFDPEEALAYVRYRSSDIGDDYARSANQQRLMAGALAALEDQEDGIGFMEAATATALGAVETDLGPADLYRLAQLVTTVEPQQVDTCVLTGTPDVTSGGADVIILGAAAAGVSEDAADFRLEDGCPD